MATALFILIWIAGIAFSIYMITQTSAQGLPPSGRSARTRVIVWGFVPIWGIEIILQFFYYSKVRSALASHSKLDQVPKTFGTPVSQTPPFGDTLGAPQGQQENKNPFL